MVLQSECAFRMMVREFGCGVCWAPMVKTMPWSAYREDYLRDLQAGGPADRPLVAQLCGTSARDLVVAAAEVQSHCDAVCLNLGCPQRTARAAGFGAFLMDRPELVREIVEGMVAALGGTKTPLFAKIRIFEDISRTLDFVRMLENAGVSLITVHGRTRDNTHHSGPCDWQAIRACVEAVGVPVIANGGVYTLEDAHKCLSITGAVAVMGAGGLLRNPRLFDVKQPAVRDAYALGRAYLRACRDYSTSTSPRHIRDHMRSLLRKDIDRAAGQRFYDMFKRQLRVCTRQQWCLLITALAVEHGIEDLPSPKKSSRQSPLLSSTGTGASVPVTSSPSSATDTDSSSTTGRQNLGQQQCTERAFASTSAADRDDAAKRGLELHTIKFWEPIGPRSVPHYLCRCGLDCLASAAAAAAAAMPPSAAKGTAFASGGSNPSAAAATEGSSSGGSESDDEQMQFFEALFPVD